jgi:hypothetical protein
MCPRKQIATGFESELFWCSTIDKNVDWINYCCRNLKLRHRILRQCRRKQGFIVPAQIQWTCIQRLSLKNKEVSFYISLQVTQAKPKLNPNMAACDFIGYFISPVLCDLLHISVL